jgi:prepilin-type N-terminal cleavage/methylation domain-containing protein
VRKASFFSASPSGLGFTLLELLVVLVIIGLLAGYVAPQYFSQSYIYKSPGQHGDYDLYSFGKDGAAGGTGDAADIVSWK